MRVGKWHQVPGAQTPLIPNLARPAVALNGDGSFSIFYTQGPSSPRIMTARIFATVDKVKLDINGWVPLDDNSAFRPTSSPSAVEYLDGTIAITAFGMMTLDGSFPTNESTSASVNNQSVDISNSIIPSATPYTCVWERTGSLIPTTCTGDGPAKKIGSLFWCPWTHFVGQINLPTTNPLITSSRNGMKSIYIRGRDGHLLRRWFTVGYGWDPYWWDLGGCMATDPGGCEQYVVASMGEHQTFFSTTSFNLVPVNVQPPITVQQPSDISDINLGFWCKMDGTNESDFPESPVP